MDDKVWALVLAALPVTGGVVAALVPRWAEVREQRRTRYAEAVESLLAWAEFPYRIARRVGDDAGILAGLAALGHELQERLAFHCTWASAESQLVGDLYQCVMDELRPMIGQAANEAWLRSPVSCAADMNIGDLGIDHARLVSLLGRVAAAARTRFGWRRLLGRLNARRKVFSELD